MKGAGILAFVVSVQSAASAQQPIVRAHLQPDGHILVGQPVRMTVSVLVPNYFTGSPDFPEFEIDNAIVVLPQDRPQNSSERIGGKTFAAITETYTIYPQQPGHFELPPAQITVSFASSPPKSTVAHVPLPHLAFRAEIPAAAADLDYFLPTTQLTLSEKWSRSLSSLKAGDAIERTITVQATRMQAMVIPPLPLAAPDGIRIYPDEPFVHDQKSARGDFLFGRRAQSAKYFFQKKGTYSLPAIELKWWNLSTNRLVTATLPAVQIDVAANPNLVTELPPSADTIANPTVQRVSFWKRNQHWIRSLAPICAACLLVLFASWIVIPRAFGKWTVWRTHRDQSELAYYRRLRSACRRNNAREAYVDLLKWISAFSRDTSLELYLIRSGDNELSSEVESLGAVLFDSSRRNSSWKGKRLAALTWQSRNAHTGDASSRSRLVGLNPGKAASEVFRGMT